MMQHCARNQSSNSESEFKESRKMEFSFFPLNFLGTDGESMRQRFWKGQCVSNVFLNVFPICSYIDISCLFGTGQLV